MKWNDTALVLSLRKFSERDAILAVLTQDHGVWRAMVKGALSRHQRAAHEPGNLLLVHWNARLAEHMGNFTCEMLEQNAARLMQHKVALTVLQSATALVEGCFEERDPHPALFSALRGLIQEIRDGAPREAALAHYLHFESRLLAEAGYGLDLSCCAATGQRHDLIYISPNSGRAVCREAGAPYHARMLPLPRLLREVDFAPEPAEILDALKVNSYFLRERIYAPVGRKLPDARQQLEAIMEQGIHAHTPSSALHAEPC